MQRPGEKRARFGYCTMNTKDLCAWLRANSSGVYRPAAEAADELERMRIALLKIALLDPATDSEEGHNEWGEADCFNQAQTVAREALGDA